MTPPHYICRPSEVRRWPSWPRRQTDAVSDAAVDARPTTRPREKSRSDRQPYLVIVLGIGLMSRAAMLVALLCCSSGILWAQGGTTRPVFRLAGGSSIPLGCRTFTSGWNVGPHVSGTVGYPVTRGFVLEGQVEYNNFPYDELRNQQTGPGLSIFAATAIAVGRLQISGSGLAPYFLGGFGLSRISGAYPTELDPSVTFGAGADLMITQVLGLFLDARGSITFGEGYSRKYLPLRVGIVAR